MSVRAPAAAFAFAAALCLALLAVFQAPPAPAYGQTIPPPAVTVYVSPAVASVMVGSAIQVTVTVAAVPACPVSVWHIILTQGGSAHFSYVDPPGHTVGPPAPNPMVYRLKAVSPGATRFTASVYAAPDCGDVVDWEYADGSSPEVQVVEMYPYRLALPSLLKSAY